MQKIHCDRDGCDKTTPAEGPGMGWLRVECISTLRTIDEQQEKHYCSRECEHLATAP